MTTEMLTLVHPDRNDTITVSTAAARIRRKAGWITETEAEALPALAELTDEQRAELADLVAALDAEPDPNHNPAIVPGTETPEPAPKPKKSSGRTRATATKSKED